MTSGQHYHQGLQYLIDAVERDAGVEIAMLNTALAQACFLAAQVALGFETQEDSRRYSALRRASGPSA